MIISQCLYFQFGDINSTEFDIINCKIDSGLFNEPFLAPRTIKETQIRGRSPYFQEVERQNLSFSVTFAFRSGWDTKEKLREVARWLDSDYYKPLIFYDDLIPNGEEVIYYSILSDAPQIVHNGRNEGYLTLQFKTNSSYGFSPIYLSQNTRISGYFLSPWQPTPIPKNIEFINDGDINIKPIIFVKTLLKDFSIVNLSNGQILKFTGLELNETLEIDTDLETITSSLGSTTYRINNMTSDSTFLSMERGVNVLQCLGNFEFQIKYEFKYST